MGYHATLPKIHSSFNSSENEVIPSEREQTAENVSIAPGKYFLATGKEYPFCRKYILKLCLLSFRLVSINV